MSLEPKMALKRLPAEPEEERRFSFLCGARGGLTGRPCGRSAGEGGS
jgi:hypothetical protein